MSIFTRSTRQLPQLIRFLSGHPLTRDRRAAALVRFGRWQIASRLRREVIVPWVGGTRLAVRRGMTGVTGNIYTGLHEFADMAFTLHFLRPGDEFADVGANVGSYTILASGVCGASSIAFEPDPRTMEFLQRNIELNDLRALVRTEQAALGATEGEVDFTVGRDTENRVAQSHTGPTRHVALRTLDSMVASRPPTMIKIDVEGYEPEVMRGAQSTLVGPSLKAIITEGQQPEVVASLLDAGFEQYVYDPFRRRLSRTRGQSSPNALFLRDEPFVAARLAAAPAFRVVGFTI